MKISHFGIKFSVGILIGLILLSYFFYWKSISTLSDHMTSLLTISRQLENEEAFHSAIHSMVMNINSYYKKAEYLENRQQADIALSKLQSSLSSTAGGSDEILLSETKKAISDGYMEFRNYTDKITLLAASESVAGIELQLKKLFDNIFRVYTDLSEHHRKDREIILSKTQSIKRLTRLIMLLQVAFTVVAGLLVIIYLDRVVLKLFSVTEKMAMYDNLTGLYNRHAFDIFVSKMDRQEVPSLQQSYGLILLDIDHFKKINDNFGHPSGDQILRDLATMLLKNIRGQDRVVRIGGEEILIWLSRSDIYGTGEVAEKIRKNIAKMTFKLLDSTKSHQVTVSIGYAATSHDKGSMNDLIKVADKRLYEAKNCGRNRVVGP